MQIKFKTSMLKWGLCDYSDAAAARQKVINGDEDDKVIFKNCTPFTDCLSEKNNTRVDNVNI